MAALISRLKHLDLGDVDSFGMSGNLIVSAQHAAIEPLERALGGALGTLAFIRTRSALERVVARDPYGSSIMFLDRVTPPAARRRLAATAFIGPRPVLRGRSLYFVYPAAVEGRRTPIDFEHLLGMRGTARSSSIVRRVLSRLQGRRLGRTDRR
jgi:hypothetical protein